MSHIIVKGRSWGRPINIRNNVGCWGHFQRSLNISFFFFFFKQLRSSRKEAVRPSKRPCWEPGARHLTSLCHSFLLCKVGLLELKEVMYVKCSGQYCGLTA